ncbi:glucose-1-phosphate cytidylyltransferase [Nostoc sp. UHCC 0926]|uniref:glucose-1-phosphate cytidylyltransferase n=1 Tax=unclassified Nostoc TaxID=2593658 RepID=UPI0023629D89|nr:glucose-1-phosphate cytidylyltransferase [Nostoc sp. UHCC 0926]WDD30870.1 glucose-1-phosphate cytidylyltransferase [Nostoc sp. UHCC 0926]
MKVVILAGGLGTRLAEETEIIPKPMVEIGGRPILWHIMKIYAHYGYKDFYIALGYKGDYIKRYFLEYYNLNSSMTINLQDGHVNIHNNAAEDWILHLMDTGLDTMTAGRIKRLQPWLDNETFMVTYGDGVANLNIKELLEFHKSHKCLATVTAVRPPARFGSLRFHGDLVDEFLEKPQMGEGWINGGFLIFEPKIFNYLKGDDEILEVALLEKLANEGQLAAYRHYDFWQCMDTLRDKYRLKELWDSVNPPWKVWN